MANSVSLSNQQATAISQYIRSTWVGGFGGISWPQFESYLGIKGGTPLQRQTIARGIGAMALHQTGTGEADIKAFLEVPHGASVAELITQALIGIGSAAGFATLGGGVASDVSSESATRGVEGTSTIDVGARQLGRAKVAGDTVGGTGVATTNVDPNALTEKDAAAAGAGAVGGGVAGKIASKIGGSTASNILGAATGASVLSLLTDPNLWKRILEVVLGVALLLLGLKNLTGVDPVNIVTKTAATAAKVAK